jgi:5'-3' exonuclease
VTKGLLLIDGSNIAHAANSAQPLSIGDMPTQAIYGVLRTLRPMFSTFSMLTPIILWDGRSWRKDVFKDYKVSRDKPAETKAEKQLQEQRSQFKVQLPYIKLALKTLGVRQMFAINYEADDLAGILVNKDTERRIMMITGDKDWIQLIRKNVAWLDPVRNEKLTLNTLSTRLGWIPDKGKLGLCDGPNTTGFIGVPNPRAWLEMKALMGDISDDIPGVGGIGPKGAIELITTYGSVTGFLNSFLDHTLDRKTLPKKFAKLAEDMETRDNYQRNMILMDLEDRMKKRPVAINLQIENPTVNLDGFKKVCTKFYFKSILERFDQWTEPFATKVAA